MIDFSKTNEEYNGDSGLYRFYTSPVNHHLEELKLRLRDEYVLKMYPLLKNMSYSQIKETYERAKRTTRNNLPKMQEDLSNQI